MCRSVSLKYFSGLEKMSRSWPTATLSDCQELLFYLFALRSFVRCALDTFQRISFAIRLDPKVENVKCYMFLGFIDVRF